MIDSWLFALTLATALGCGLVAGALYAFSSFVMKALARLPAPEGIAAMQSINVEAPKLGFMASFLGTAAACIALVVISLIDWDESYAVYLLIASLLYLVGNIGLTRAYHIPRNDELAAQDPNSPEAARLWDRYVVQWTMGNHVRVAASLAAAGVLIGALRVG